MSPFCGKTPGRAGKAESFLSSAGLFLVCLAAFFLISGCTVVRGFQVPAVQEGPVELDIGDVIVTATCEVITMDELIEKTSSASIVYVGETHTSSEDHAVQLAVLRRLYDKDPCIVLGMEMFPRSAQPVLDAFVRGEMTEEEFLKQVKWAEVWGFPYSLYRGLIDFAREKHLRIIALNAPRDVVSQIAHNGLSSLAPEQRALVARDFHLDDPANRRRIQDEFNVHARGSIRDFESFFEAQLAWEETMSETLAGGLQQMPGNCRILAVIGKGHMSDRLGIPSLTNLRVPHEYETIAPIPINYPDCTCDPDLAEFVVITDQSKPMQMHRPKLGVMVRPAQSGTGVEVVNVLPDTPAEKADIRKGDIILSVDGSPVGTPEELQAAIAAGGPEHRITIQHEKRKRTISIAPR